MLDLKIEKNSVIDLTLIPGPLIVIKMLLRDRLEEGVVVANNKTADYAAENTEGKGCGETSQLETCLLRGCSFG